MPDTEPYFFELSQNLTNTFLQTHDMQQMQADAIKRGGLENVYKLIAEHRAGNSVPDSDLAAAIRMTESQGSGNDLAVGDPIDSKRKDEYSKLTPQEKYERRGEFKSWGALQIQAGIIEDVNTTFGTRYTHEDAFDRRKAVEMLYLYTARYEKAGASRRDIATNWNRGKTSDDRDEYWNKVSGKLVKIRSGS